MRNTRNQTAKVTDIITAGTIGILQAAVSGPLKMAPVRKDDQEILFTVQDEGQRRLYLFISEQVNDAQLLHGEIAQLIETLLDTSKLQQGSIGHYLLNNVTNADGRRIAQKIDDLEVDLERTTNIIEAARNIIRADLLQGRHHMRSAGSFIVHRDWSVTAGGEGPMSDVINRLMGDDVSLDDLFGADLDDLPAGHPLRRAFDGLRSRSREHARAS